MANYKYEGMNRQGSVIQGEITAVDQSSAVSHLLETGVQVIELTQTKEPKKKTIRGKKKVKVTDLALFSRQMSAMLGAGIPITQSLNTLSKQTENAVLQEALADIAARIEGGSNLTQAFSDYPKVFSPLYIAMLGAGEIGGILEVSLTRLSNQLQKEKQLNDNIKSATSYPKMIGGFAILMFLVMLTVLVPVFEGFIPSGTEIPTLTKFTFFLSRSLRGQWYVWLFATLILGTLTFKFMKSRVFHIWWEKTKLTMPLFGPIIQKSVIARFARTLATLLQGGIPVVQALESAGPTSGSDLVAEAVEKVIGQIEEGKNISGPMEETGLFPPMVVNMIAIGEEAGTLPELLDKVAEFYEEDVASMTKNLSTLIEPIMLILIGGIVGGMLLSLYLPIFTAVTA